MEGDRLVIALSCGRYALDTMAIAGIVETERLPFLPGKAGFVTGVVSFRNEPVTVIDLKGALGDFTGAPHEGHKIIVLGEKGRLLGMDIGLSRVSFVWNDELAGKATEEKGLYTSGRIYDSEGPIDMIDWQALFDETARLLGVRENV